MGASVEVVVVAGPTDWITNDDETAETMVSVDDGNTTEESGRVEFCPGNVRTGS